MEKDCTVVSFAERLEAKKKKEKEQVKQEEKATLAPSEEAEKLLDGLEDELARQKENLEIWEDGLNDFVEDCETISEILIFSTFLTAFSISLLETVLESEICDKKVKKALKISYNDNAELLTNFRDKLEQKE